MKDENMRDEHMKDEHMKDEHMKDDLSSLLLLPLGGAGREERG